LTENILKMGNTVFWDVSEELTASIFSVEKSSSEEPG
jgi:hypothetical protein